MKHTPGPWKACSHKNNRFHPDLVWSHTIETGDGKMFIATIEAFSDSDAANADLLAAAPEMLAALELIVKDNRLMSAMNREQAWSIMDVVNKARGEK